MCTHVPERCRERPLQGDPFKTLFVARLSYDVTERKLKREFEEYGPIKRIRLVHDKNSGARGTQAGATRLSRDNRKGVDAT